MKIFLLFLFLGGASVPAESHQANLEVEKNILKRTYGNSIKLGDELLIIDLGPNPTPFVIQEKSRFTRFNYYVLIENFDVQSGLLKMRLTSDVPFKALGPFEQVPPCDLEKSAELKEGEVCDYQTEGLILKVSWELYSRKDETKNVTIYVDSVGVVPPDPKRKKEPKSLWQKIWGK